MKLRSGLFRPGMSWNRVQALEANFSQAKAFGDPIKWTNYVSGVEGMPIFGGTYSNHPAYQLP
jgi:hypothetical protein